MSSLSSRITPANLTLSFKYHRLSKTYLLYLSLFMAIVLLSKSKSLRNLEKQLILFFYLVISNVMD